MFIAKHQGSTRKLQREFRIGVHVVASFSTPSKPNRLQRSAQLILGCQCRGDHIHIIGRVMIIGPYGDARPTRKHRINLVIGQRLAHDSTQFLKRETFDLQSGFPFRRGRRRIVFTFACSSSGYRDSASLKSSKTFARNANLGFIS